jgi:multidrug efflux system membrane fusion protein
MAVLLLALAVVAFVVYRGTHSTVEMEPPKPQPVRVATVELRDIPVYFQGLGTVTPENTVTVKSRVDGELVAIHFTEGQDVTAGDLLAEIDPRPFEVQLKEAEGSLARDKALLRDARLDLERYRKLIRQEAVSPQQLQSQEALVGQYEGAVRMDEASIASAKLQLEYCRITAPISGRLGLKQADLGNMIRSSDTNGLVVITQMQPMQVVFTLVEKQVPDVREAMKEGSLPVEVWDQDNKNLLAAGTLLTLDNRIDTATGTVKAKAVFSNDDDRLFPNQFVNARLMVKTLHQRPAVPTSAIQRNNDGFFVYTVTNSTVGLRPVRTGYQDVGVSVVEDGLSPGEVVVVDGVDRLRDKSRVRVSE